MIWDSDYKNGIFVSWYYCPLCGYDTRMLHYKWDTKTEPYKAESEVKE